jgi:hypothetical protein
MHCHRDRVFLMVVNQGNCLVVTFDAIDGHARNAALPTLARA